MDWLVKIGGIASAIVAIVGALTLILKWPKRKIKQFIGDSIAESKSIQDINKKLEEMDSSRNEARAIQEEKFTLLENGLAAVQIEIKHQSEKVEQIEKTLETVIINQKRLEETEKNILRETITKIYYKYVPLKYIPNYERERVSKAYDNYIERGGNSFICQIYPKIMDLPPPPDEVDI